MQLEAILFDLDGTLADTDPVHLQVFAELLKPLGYEVDDEFFRKHISGARNEILFRKFFPDYSAEEIIAAGEAKEALFRDKACHVQPVDGLGHILQWAAEKQLRLALVTNAPRSNVSFMLSSLGLEDTFEIMVMAEDVTEGKPNPAPYLLALEKLGISADRSIVFEDSLTGIRSAKGAGLRVYGMMTTLSVDKLHEAGADVAIEDYNDDRLWEELNRRTA
jgi:haloacid dehalogenase superfamily, subfamily IA, variant 3 with third motif having DD or ED